MLEHVFDIVGGYLDLFSLSIYAHGKSEPHQALQRQLSHKDVV